MADSTEKSVGYSWLGTTPVLRSVWAILMSDRPSKGVLHMSKSPKQIILRFILNAPFLFNAEFQKLVRGERKVIGNIFPSFLCKF